HLGGQGRLSIAKYAYPQLEEQRDSADRHLQELASAGPDAILFDTGSRRHLTEVGRLIAEQAARETPLFVVGSSGLEYALTQWWQESEGLSGAPDRYDTIHPVDRILVISASASKLTAVQIDAAIEAGF